MVKQSPADVTPATRLDTAVQALEGAQGEHRPAAANENAKAGAGDELPLNPSLAELADNFDAYRYQATCGYEVVIVATDLPAAARSIARRLATCGQVFERGGVPVSVEARPGVGGPPDIKQLDRYSVTMVASRYISCVKRYRNNPGHW